VPICYLILEDIKGAFSNYWDWQTGRKPEPKAAWCLSRFLFSI